MGEYKQLFQLLNFLETQWYDEKVYFSLPVENSDDRVEVYRSRSTDKGWYAGTKSSSVKIEFDVSDLPEEIELLGASVEDLELKVIQRCLDIASYAYTQASKVSEILGEQAILDNLEAHKIFNEQLVAIIKKALGVDKKPKLTLITEKE